VYEIYNSGKPWYYFGGHILYCANLRKLTLLTGKWKEALCIPKPITKPIYFRIIYTLQISSEKFVVIVSMMRNTRNVCILLGWVFAIREEFLEFHRSAGWSVYPVEHLRKDTVTEFAVLHLYPPLIRNMIPSGSDTASGVSCVARNKFRRYRRTEVKHRGMQNRRFNRSFRIDLVYTSWRMQEYHFSSTSPFLTTFLLFRTFCLL